ncbi:cytochrome c oxidase assembly protein COX15 homolog isoform X2 [Hylaeus volcanicus]|uniref:cytochrome c oxidase assembly protein COX15 homolog isoform X2 n=1 Tax=Hylaeus volcanicus TaxID=313075 RepID=UPI0023B86FDA|nr:cytochrome c oxidase assembly protein COX15 homolog isoform X2 [Hylaeus volcanicus]
MDVNLRQHGGVTRLTESGLSMVTWKLLGEKLPTSDRQWHAEFERYKQFPEYKITNRNMTLEEFKRIWWMEYLHRMWGRLIGAVFIVPAAYFWAKGMLKPGMKTRVSILGLLIGLQGLMGWYMVKSGLENRFTEPSDVPRVSQYRLAAHLGMAFIIYTGFLYNALDHLIPAQSLSLNTSSIEINVVKQKLKRFRMLVHSTKGIVFLTAMSGAFVAGMDAGLIYNTFPKMADKWLPDDLLAISPTWKNFTENPTAVQFDHRLLGIVTLSLITCIGIASRNHRLPGNAKKAIAAVLCAGYLQVLLGISTLLHHVPLALAATHQSGSLLVLSTMIWLCHELKYLKYIVK